MPLSAMLPPASSMTRRLSPSSWAISGTRPNRMPCSESQRMHAPIRLVPSSAKQVSETDGMDRREQGGHRASDQARR